MRTDLSTVLAALLLASLSACGGDLLNGDALDEATAAEGLEVVSLAFNDVTLRISSTERFTVVDRDGAVLDRGLTLEQLQASYPDLADRYDLMMAGPVDATLYVDDFESTSAPASSEYEF